MSLLIEKKSLKPGKKLKRKPNMLINKKRPNIDMKIKKKT